MTDQKAKPYYTIRDLAELLQVSGMTIRRRMDAGDLPYYKIGDAVRFRPEDVEAFLDARRVNHSTEGRKPTNSGRKEVRK